MQESRPAAPGTSALGDSALGHSALGHSDRVRLEALRYATLPEAGEYLAVMRVFTGEVAGLMADQSAQEVAARLADQGIDVDQDTAEARLSYLVEHGNLARSPRETEAHSVREYLQSRSRYQLTQIGELAHRQVEELLGAVEEAREISSEMLGGILAGLQQLAALDPDALVRVEPPELAAGIGTVFAQFERLVDSTRDFYTYLSRVLARFDLDRAEFQAFKTVLLNYLQRLVDEVALHMPQLADVLQRLTPRIDALCARANEGERLVDQHGRRARRALGLEPRDWDGLRAWFLGTGGRDSDAAGVRHLATSAMRALLVNLRRIAADSEREASRYADLLQLARWFAGAADPTAHALWAAAFGLYPARHLSLAGPDDGHPIPATESWWTAPPVEVPLTLRRHGQRTATGRSGKREDFGAAKGALLARRAESERRRAAALAELGEHTGPIVRLTVSDDARTALLALYSTAMAEQGVRLTGFDGDDRHERASATQQGLTLHVRRTPGHGTTIVSPSGRLVLGDVTLEVQAAVVELRDGRHQEVSA